MYIDKPKQASIMGHCVSSALAVRVVLVPVTIIAAFIRMYSQLSATSVPVYAYVLMLCNVDAISETWSTCSGILALCVDSTSLHLMLAKPFTSTAYTLARPFEKYTVLMYNVNCTKLHACKALFLRTAVLSLHNVMY